MNGAYSITVLSIHRYRVTVYPLHVRISSAPTWRSTGATICGVWIVAALFAIPSACSKYLSRLNIFLLRTNYYRHVAIFELLVSCVLPLCVIAFSYITTARHLVKGCSVIPGETQNPQQNSRKITAKVVFGLTIVFLISYVPYHIYYTYFYSMNNLDIYRSVFSEKYLNPILFEIFDILEVVLSFNSCLNPVAMFCTSRAFRRQLKNYLTCCCKTNSPPTAFELTSRNWDSEHWHFMLNTSVKYVSYKSLFCYLD
jgi:hypothetical protein